MLNREIAVVASNDNKDVGVIKTIDAIKMQDLKMFLYNGAIRNGILHRKNN